ncbi:MAG: pyrroloquinoline-quinone synthase [Solirubrobacteraceae bacterium]|nr:pyrroloquinoline-quinone synthase [Solirubrobacteraceae bacterium]
MSDLLDAVSTELDRCAVGRDNPTHRRLVAGELTPAELRVWGAQQWLWHRAFPGVLATLAAQCPVPELRGALLRRASLEDGALAAESPGRCAEWARVAHALGVSGADLAAATPIAETEMMIAVQRMVAARPFAEGWVGIMVGVDGETQSHNAARRRTMNDRYGVPAAALEYVRVPDGDPVAPALETIEPHLDGALDGAVEALRLVLHARWNYFSGLTREAERLGAAAVR